MRFPKHVFLLLALCVSSGLSAQPEEAVQTDTYSEELEEVVVEPEVPVTIAPNFREVTEYPPVSKRPIGDAQWQKAAESLDYSADLPEKQKARKPRAPREPSNFSGWNFDAPWLGSFLQWLAIALLVAVVAWGVYKMMKAPRNRSIVASDGTPITIENLENYLHETDLERFLREALANGNYTQAVRVYYLQIIKDLSNKEAIQWSREKTNRDYLREMQNHLLAAPFRTATNTYERVWYGNRSLSADEYAPVEHQMRDLLERI